MILGINTNGDSREAVAKYLSKFPEKANFPYLIDPMKEVYKSYSQREMPTVLIIDQNNDLYYYAFEDSRDFRRYWKDYNIHLNIDKKFKNILASINLVYIRSLNYQWEIDPLTEPWYHPGRDVNNFHVSMKLLYQIPTRN